MRELMTEEKLKQIIFTNLGQASMCWSEIPKGVFDSSKAEMLGYEILEAFAKLLEDKLLRNNQ